MSKIRHYNRQAHRRWRESVLRRAGYLCEECKRYGIHTPATVAHHIKPRKEHPELALQVDNGQALCASCHKRKHPEVHGRGQPPAR